VSAKANAEKTLPLQNASATTASADSRAVLAASSDVEHPGEKAAVILSSKGAEKRLTHSVRATYPAAARSTGAEGTVVVKTVVDERGSVAAAQAVEGNPALARAAVAAVKQWRYRPYVRDGKTLPFQTVVLVDFQKP
jgi:TonB family protein